VYRSLVCDRCLVEVIHNRSRSVRVGHVQLHRRVAHPWFVAEVATLLDTSQSTIRASDPDELAEQLDAIDLIALEVGLELQLTEARSDERKQAIEARLGVVRAMLASHTQPRSLLLERLPVMPPELERPGLHRARVRAAYIELLDAPDPSQAVAALFACFRGER
jgi:DNA-directed RNA polymerase subunit beta'